MSFLVFLGENEFIPEDQIPELVLRTLFLPVVGYLTYQLAQANQEEKHKAQQAAEELASANRSLKKPKPKCAAPSAWRPWDNSPPAWRTSCAIRWAP